MAGYLIQQHWARRAVTLGLFLALGFLGGCGATGPDLYYSLDGQLSIYIDEDRSIKPHEITGGAKDGQFQKALSNRINLGFFSGDVWLRLDLKQPGQVGKSPGHLWTALIQNTRIDEVDLYSLGPGGNYTLHTAGFARPHSMWPEESTYPTFILSPQEVAHPIYMRVSNRGSLVVEILALPESSLTLHTLNYAFSYGLYFGILLVMLIYNSFVGLIVRERTWFLYIGYIAVLALFVSDISGFSYRYLWPESADWQRRSTAVFGGGLIFCTVIFAANFLNVRRLLPGWYFNIMAGLSAAAALVVGLAFVLPIRPLLQVLNALALAGNVAVFIAALVCFRRGQRAARFFFIAWSAFLIGSLVTVFYYLGLLPNSFITNYAIQWSSALTVTLLSFALADRFNSMRSEMNLAMEAQSAAEAKLEAIDEDLRLAKTIQESLLPRGIPELSGARLAVKFRPSHEVSGDFYDFHLLSKYEAGVLLTDVSGHGIPAAILSSMVKVGFANERSAARRPERLINNMSHFLLPHLGEQYVTGLYAYMNLPNRRLRLVRAGHPPALYWDSDKRQMETIYPRGNFVGFDLEPYHECYERRIAPGDRLVMFTDGVVECASKNGDVYGPVRLAKFIEKNHSLAPEDLARAILSELSRWSHETMPYPDVSPPSGPDFGTELAQTNGFDDDLALIVVGFE